MKRISEHPDPESFTDPSPSFDLEHRQLRRHPFPPEFYKNNVKLMVPNLRPVLKGSNQFSSVESIQSLLNIPVQNISNKSEEISGVQSVSCRKDIILPVIPGSKKARTTTQPIMRKRRKSDKHDMKFVGKTVIIKSDMVHPTRIDSLTPEKYLLGKLFVERGYDNTLTRTLNQQRFSPPNDERVLSYTTELVTAVRTGDIEMLSTLKSKGLSMSACNRFGESILHIAARRGEIKTFAFLLKSVDNIYVSDDQGRTILHDACWSANPNFNVITMILDLDSSLLRATDVRGSTPLAYIKREHWQRWYEFFDRVKETYWPPIHTSSSLV